MRRWSNGELAAVAVERSGLAGLLRGLETWHGALVIAYHRFTNAATVPEAAVRTPADVFDAQLRHLARHCTVVAPGDIPEAVRAGDRVVVLTVDDGYRDGHDVALPVLQAHGLPATFFVTTRFLDGRARAWWDDLRWMVEHSRRSTLPAAHGLPQPLALRGAAREAAVVALQRAYSGLPEPEARELLAFVAEATGVDWRARPTAGEWLTWELARRMRGAGMFIGGHTASHPVLSRVPPERQAAEVAECRHRLEEELGEPMRYFAYPVGQRDSFDEASRAAIAGEGVELAFSCYGGYSTAATWDPYDVRRCTVSSTMRFERFTMATVLPQVYARW
jgi:peptidoglycan/xylan/chitin deacetylase (PgdA/CDA1 family)